MVTDEFSSHTTGKVFKVKFRASLLAGGVPIILYFPFLLIKSAYYPHLNTDYFPHNSYTTHDLGSLKQSHKLALFLLVGGSG